MTRSGLSALRLLRRGPVVVMLACATLARVGAAQAQVQIQPSPPAGEVAGVPTQARVSLATDQLPYEVGKGPKLGPYYLIRSEDSLDSLHVGPGRVGSDAPDLFDPLKYIRLDPSGDAFLTLSYDQRVRYENYSVAQFGFRRPEHQTLISTRESAGADLHLGEHFRLYGDLESGQVGGANYGTPQPVNRNDLTALQAFTEAYARVDDATVGVRAGRQEMVLGNGLLFAARDATNIQQSYDGVRAYVDAQKFRVDGFFLENVLNHHGTFSDASTPHQSYWGLYGSLRLPTKAGLFLDPYYVGYYNRRSSLGGLAGSEARSMFGGRLWGVAGPVDLDWTATYQTGSQAGHAASAFGVFTNTGYNLRDLPMKPRVGLHLDVGSGGRGRDGSVHTFEPLNFSAIYFTEAPVLAPMNLYDAGVGLSASVTPRIRVQAILSAFWRVAQNDFVYNFVSAPYARTNRVRGTFVGLQPALRAAWTINRHLLLVSQLAVFKAGESLTRAGGQDEDFVSSYLLFRF